MYPLGAPRLEFDVQRHAVLLTVADAICLRHEAGELIRDLAPQLRSVVEFDVVTFARFDSSRKIMKLFLWEGAEWPPEPLEIAVEDAAVGSVWRNQKALAIDDLSAEKRFGPELRWLREHHLQSYCVLPLTTVQEKLGALGFGRKQPHAFKSGDIQFLQRVGEMVALSVDTTLAKAALLDECARLRLLLEVGAPHIRVSDLPQSVASILESMQKWAARDYVGVYLYDESSQALRLHMPDPQLAEKFAPRGLASLDGTLAGQAFRNRQRMVLDHSGLAGLPFNSVKRGTELGVQSLCLAPLLSTRGPLGVLKVARRENHPFSPRDVELLEQVAATVAPALERVKTEGHPENETVPSPILPKLSGMLAANGTAVHPDRLQDLATGSAPGSLALPEALSEWEQLLTAYVNASQVGLCILDTNFHFLAINNALAEMNGLPAGSHLGKASARCWAILRN